MNNENSNKNLVVHDVLALLKKHSTEEVFEAVASFKKDSSVSKNSESLDHSDKNSL